MGPVRMMYRSLAELETSMAAELRDRGRFMRNAQPTGGRRHLLVIIDDGYVGGTEHLTGDVGLDSLTVLDLTAPQAGLAARRGLQLVVADGMVAAKSAAGAEKFATADTVTGAEAQALARDLARYRIATAAQVVSLGDDTSADPGLMALLKIPDATQLDPARVWRPRTPRERLRVPIGITPDGTPVELDIKESAENGARRPATSPTSPTMRRLAQPAPHWIRCRRCSSSSTSSPNCCRRSPISRSCS